MTNNTSTETSLMERLEFGEWKILRVLGSGTFGKVLLLKNEETDEMIAVKKCHVNSPAVNPENWKKEVDIVKSLKHPGIFRVLCLVYFYVVLLKLVYLFLNFHFRCSWCLEVASCPSNPCS